MNFLNIGPMELILIFILALIVLGPRRLPKVARDLGEALSSFRRATQELEKEIGRELGTITEAPLGTTQATAKASQDGVLQPLDRKESQDDG